MVKIALVSCGTEYSGIQKEIEKAANTFEIGRAHV